MRRSHVGPALLPALLSALLLVAAFPPFHLVVPSFVALVPLAVWVARLDSGAVGRRAAVRGALLFGAVHYAILLYWVVPALAWVTAAAVPAFLAMVGLLAALAAGFGWALHRAVHAAGTPLWLALPVTWTGMEWVRAHLPGGLAFPWLELGTSLTGFPELVGIAELVGTRGVSFWLAGVNGLLAAAIVALPGAAGAGDRSFGRSPGRSFGRVPVPLLGAAAMVAVIPAAWGFWRAATLDTRVAARVAVVQPNIPADVKRDPAVALERTLEALDRLVPRLRPSPPDLVVLPEGVFSFDAGAPERSGATAQSGAGAALTLHARTVGAPLLVGAYDFGAGRNSVLVFTPDGPARERYDKQRLVPLVERDIWLFPVGGASEVPLGLFRPGPEGALVEAGGVPIGLLICWEAVFQEDVRRHRRAGAELLVNATNDAWYGDGSSGGPTTALRQHPAHLVMRAIETRMGAVRAANTGVSFFVDPTGRTNGEIPLSTEEVGVADVRTSDIVTLHTRLGDVVGRGSAAASLLLVLWGLGAGMRMSRIDSSDS